MKRIGSEVENVKLPAGIGVKEREEKDHLQVLERLLLANIYASEAFVAEGELGKTNSNKRETSC